MQKQARDVQRGEEGEDDIPGLKPSPTAFFNHDSGRININSRRRGVWGTHRGNSKKQINKMKDYINVLFAIIGPKSRILNESQVLFKFNKTITWNSFLFLYTSKPRVWKNYLYCGAERVSRDGRVAGDGQEGEELRQLRWVQSLQHGEIFYVFILFSAHLHSKNFMQYLEKTVTKHNTISCILKAL